MSDKILRSGADEQYFFELLRITPIWSAELSNDGSELADDDARSRDVVYCHSEGRLYIMGLLAIEGRRSTWYYTGYLRDKMRDIPLLISQLETEYVQRRRQAEQTDHGVADVDVIIEGIEVLTYLQDIAARRVKLAASADPFRETPATPSTALVVRGC